MILQAVLGFGSNKGNRLLYLKKAVRQLSIADEFNLLSVSSVYESEPWGVSEQRKYYNCAAVFMCKLSASAMLRFIKDAEIRLGRTNFKKWAEREIDIDILFLGDTVINSAGLTVPHPYITERNFVLVPLCEIIPYFIHPVMLKTVSYLKNKSRDRGGVKLVKGVSVV